MNQHILDKVDIVSGIVPINVGSARTGDTITMKNYGRCAIVFFKAAGSASEDPTLTIEQAVSITPSSAKALNYTRVDVKQGATALTSVGTWTTSVVSATNTYTNTTLSENEALIVVDIKAEDLDVDNGFDCLRVTIADAGSVNQIAAVLYILHEPRYAKAGGVSAIAN